MYARLITKNEQPVWNRFLATVTAPHLLQTWEFGVLREQMHTPVVRIGIQDGNDLVAGAQMTLHRIPHLPFSVGYIPRGPVCTDPATQLPILSAFLKTYAREHRLAFIKIEPNINNHSVQTDIWQEALRQTGCVRSPNPRFMNATSMIDLQLGEDQLLQNCRKNTRYAIRRAQRDGITIREAQDKKDLRLFYDLLTQTAQRQGFQLGARPLSYFEHFWEQFHNNHPDPNKHLRLFFAEQNGQLLVTVLNVYSGGMAYYPYGGSSDDARSSNAPEALLWHSILEAKAAGCTAYDLWGVLAQEDTNHPYWGYTFFKNGFGGELTEFIGSYDLPTMPLLYKPLLWLEKTRRLMLRHTN